MGKFFTQVYEVVAGIPHGRVMTYGQISKLLQSPYSAKIVGYAMSSAPRELNLPCHRVLNRLGESAPGAAFGGPGNQRRMLEAEGVPFLPDGRVDLKQVLYEPEPEDFFDTDLFSDNP